MVDELILTTLSNADALVVSEGGTCPVGSRFVLGGVETRDFEMRSLMLI